MFGHVDVGRRDGHSRVSSVADFSVTPRRGPRVRVPWGRDTADVDKTIWIKA